MTAITERRTELRRVIYAVLMASCGIGAVGTNVTWARQEIEAPTPTIRDAIEMVRIQDSVAKDGVVATWSPAGTSAAFVTWQGLTKANVNLYKMMLIEGLDSSTRTPQVRQLSEANGRGDGREIANSPFSKISFVGSGEAVAYIGQDVNGVSQVFLQRTAGGERIQLTYHSADVRDYTFDSVGNLIGYSAIRASVSDPANSKLTGGVFLWDRSAFPTPIRYNVPEALYGSSNGLGDRRQYFVKSGSSWREIFDSSRNEPSKAAGGGMENAARPIVNLGDDALINFVGTFASDPSGKRVVVFPFGRSDASGNLNEFDYYRNHPRGSFASQLAAPYGLLNVENGQIEPLIDAPHPVLDPASGPPLWAPDGKSVLIYSLSPDDLKAAPTWLHVELSPRTIRRANLPEGWKPLRWEQSGRTLLLQKGDTEYARTRLLRDQSFDKLEVIGNKSGFNRGWRSARRGEAILGVVADLNAAPELAWLSPAAKTPKLLTDLNPKLRQMNFGEAREYGWTTRTGASSSGFLVRPVGYRKDMRYPLVVYLDDGTLSKSGPDFLFDGVKQLSGNGIQMLASEGFVVLYVREPRFGDAIMTSKEGDMVVDHIEGAIKALDAEGVIDPSRVGVSGWSRAGYHVDYLLMHSSLKFAAAISIDGGGREYNDEMRLYTDQEISRITTPKLFETHGAGSLVMISDMAFRMQKMGIPAEILHFQTAPHDTVLPDHRSKSLETNIDWFRFWLQGREDDDVGKRPQYEQWRTMRSNAGMPTH